MKRTPAREYPAGFFTALIRLHNWPPNFEPQMGHDQTEFQRKAAAAVARERALTTGGGWGPNSITLPNSLTSLAPKMMERAR